MNEKVIPDSLRKAIEMSSGSQSVLSFMPAYDGFSEAVKGTVVYRNGEKRFVKACRINDVKSLEILRREEGIVQQLPDNLPIPKYYGSEEFKAWHLLIFEYIEHTKYSLFWNPTDIDALLLATSKLYIRMSHEQIVAPEIKERGVRFDSFRKKIDNKSLYNKKTDILCWAGDNIEILRELEEIGTSIINGDTLIHCDLSPQNVLISTQGIYYIDWAHARLGNPVFDLISMILRLPARELQRALQLLRLHYPCDVYTNYDFAALASLLTGMFLERALSQMGGNNELREMRLSFGINGLKIIRNLINN